MLKPKIWMKIQLEIVGMTNVLDRRYLKSDKQSDWYQKVISAHDVWQQSKQELIDANTMATDLRDLDL
jgi:hypothetical protein